jgi:predicted peptidase
MSTKAMDKAKGKPCGADMRFRRVTSFGSAILLSLGFLIRSLVGIVLAFATICLGGESRQQPALLDATTPHRVHLRYLLFLPSGYASTPDTRWPLILYLHGGSLRGEDVERLRGVGLPHIVEGKADFPFVVLSPLCPAGEIWTDVDAIDALLDRVLHEHRIDPSRVYVTGHSMGGRGALYFAYRLPSRFAAVLSLSPYSPITAWGEKLTQIPLRIVHGTADTLAPIADSKDLIRAIETGGGHPRFDVLEGRDHFILDLYDKPEVYQWLLRHERSGPVSQPAPGP